MENISKVCNVTGYSGDSFYRFQELYEKGENLHSQDLSRHNEPKKDFYFLSSSLSITLCYVYGNTRQ
ncbi:hypothetical protein LEP1GSC027_0348 [Leptospira interrogans str. 2002000624]|nr:hypothetical protein LEP1GSC027_0348 [Leptospira interrogans str. 2002000624]